MPRHQPLDKPTPGEQLQGMKVKMRKEADGSFVPVVPPKKTAATTESKPDPRDQPDPRPVGQQNIPPYGAGI
jgi:hypothetical protein